MRRSYGSSNQSLQEDGEDEENSMEEINKSNNMRDSVQ